MTVKEASFGMFIVIINTLWLIGEVCLVGMCIYELHIWKMSLDAGEQYDSKYISYIVLYIGCMVLGVCILAVIAELIANIFLFKGLRNRKNMNLKVYLGITVVITILSTISAILFDIYNGYYLFGDSMKYRIIVRSFWFSKIVSNFLSVILVGKLYQYVNYKPAHSAVN